MILQEQGICLRDRVEVFDILLLLLIIINYIKDDWINNVVDVNKKNCIIIIKNIYIKIIIIFCATKQFREMKLIRGGIDSAKYSKNVVIIIN